MDGSIAVPEPYGISAVNTAYATPPDRPYLPTYECIDQSLNRVQLQRRAHVRLAALSQSRAVRAVRAHPACSRGERPAKRGRREWCGRVDSQRSWNGRDEHHSQDGRKQFPAAGCWGLRRPSGVAIRRSDTRDFHYHTDVKRLLQDVVRVRS